MRVRYDICFVFANRDKLPAILKSGLHLSFLTALNYNNGFILAQRRQTFKVLHKLAILERINFSNQGPVVQRPISANPGLNFNLGFFFFCSEAFSRIIFSILFRASTYQILRKKNITEFTF